MISGMILQMIMNTHGNTKITNKHMQVNITLNVLMSDGQGNWLATTWNQEKLFTNNETAIREALEDDIKSSDFQSKLLATLTKELIDNLGVIEI